MEAQRAKWEQKILGLQFKIFHFYLIYLMYVEQTVFSFSPFVLTGLFLSYSFWPHEAEVHPYPIF